MSVDWPVRRLIDVVSLPVGQVSPLDEPYRGQILLAPDHISAGTGEILKRETAESQGAVSGKYVVRPGDVVFSKIRPALRKVVLADFEGICSADTYPLKPGADVVGEFVKAVLLGESFSRYVESLSGRTGIPKVNRADLAGFSFPVPPLPEQQRIVDVLQSVAKLERGIEASITKLRTARDAIFSRAVESASYGAQTTRTVSLGSLLERMEAGWSPACDTEPPRRGEWGVVRVSAVTSGRFAPHESKRLPPNLSPRPDLEIRCGDLLMARANGARNLVGTVCLVGENPGRLMLSDKTLRLLPKEDMARTDFLSIALSAKSVRNQIEAMLSGSTGQGNISQTAVRSIVVPKISVCEQREIVKIVGSVDRNIVNETSELAKLCELKSGLVDDLLTGRVAVSVAGG